jgi:pimeloyl-ACP methyl ester carboxylesterase
MKTITLFLGLLICAIPLFGQTITRKYDFHIRKADSLYQVKDFKNSAFVFSAAFKAPDSKITINHRYNAACSWALANYPDSAFFHLNYIAAKMNYTDYGHIKGDPDFKSLHGDKRWQPLTEQVKANKDLAYSKIEFITVNGYKVETLTSGLQNIKSDKPAVVFENGMASSFGSWDTVAEEISKTNAVFRYNRPRIGESENDSLPPTTEHIVNNLRNMLLQKGLKPPYLLVSHSFGGAYIRSYASMYPKEIAGLVFVDPVDFTQKKEDGDLPYLEIGLTKHQIDSMFGKPYENFVEKLYEEMPTFYVEEVKISRALFNSEFRECDFNPLPNVPVHFLQSGGFANNEPPTIYDREKMWRISSNIRMKRWLALINPLKFGKYFYSSQSGHNIQQDDPDLVISSIKLALKDYDKIRKVKGD